MSKIFHTSQKLNEFLQRNMPLVETTIVLGWTQMLSMLLEARAGNLEAAVVSDYCNAFRAAQKAMPDQVECFTCSKNNFLPGGFACIHRTIVSREGNDFMVSGICSACCDQLGMEGIREELYNSIRDAAGPDASVRVLASFDLSAGEGPTEQ
jgi:hypothetical protein